MSSPHIQASGDSAKAPGETSAGTASNMKPNPMPWPAWDDVEDIDDGCREAWLRSWAPQPVEPSGNLAGWH
eukprot:7964694-Prorocentrum_lima.AAC.1